MILSEPQRRDIRKKFRKYSWSFMKKEIFTRGNMKVGTVLLASLSGRTIS